MAGKTNGKGKKDKGKGDKYVTDTVAVILKRDCAEALYAALVVALGTLPTPKKKKKKKGKKDKGKENGKGKGKDGGGGKGGGGKGGGGKGGKK
jgi:hypothetical protein